MFKCQICERITEPREPQFTIVIETRERIAPKKGTEIVKEIKVCAYCK